jgi:hypothetical protein
MTSSWCDLIVVFRLQHQTIAREQRQGTIALKAHMRMMTRRKNNKSERLRSAL